MRGQEVYHPTLLVVPLLTSLAPVATTFFLELGSTWLGMTGDINVFNEKFPGIDSVEVVCSSPDFIARA